jgi:hypothetical protein
MEECKDVALASYCHRLAMLYLHAERMRRGAIGFTDEFFVALWFWPHHHTITHHHAAA